MFLAEKTSYLRSDYVNFFTNIDMSGECINGWYYHHVINRMEHYLTAREIGWVEPLSVSSTFTALVWKRYAWNILTLNNGITSSV